MTRLSDLTPDPRNARRHPDRNIEMIALSLQEVGAGRSIVIDEDEVILAGNGVVEAARMAGLDRVRIVPADGDELIAVQRTNLTPDQKTALALYDNRTAELSEWDPSVIQAVQATGAVDLGSMFTDIELGHLFDRSVWDTMGSGDRHPEPGQDPGPTLDHHQPEPDGEEPDLDGERRGDLLQLLNVTISDPAHLVETGQVWDLDRHVLCVASVQDGFPIWAGELTRHGEAPAGVLFCPYPGSMIPLSRRARTHRLVMVQPNHYIAGHILDRYCDVYGPEGVRLRD